MPDLGSFVDAAATLVFFFWDPWSSFDFLFLLLPTSAILRMFCKRCRNSQNKFAFAGRRTSQVAGGPEIEGRFPNFFWSPLAEFGYRGPTITRTSASFNTYLGSMSGATYTEHQECNHLIKTDRAHTSSYSIMIVTSNMRRPRQPKQSYAEQALTTTSKGMIKSPVLQYQYLISERRPTWDDTGIHVQ